MKTIKGVISGKREKKNKAKSGLVKIDFSTRNTKGRKYKKNMLRKHTQYILKYQ